jgi:hypothetical protein
MSRSKKIASRKTKKPVQLATSSVITEKTMQLTDEELSVKFAQPVARVRQARYACGFFRIRPFTEQEDNTIRALLTERVPMTRIAEALGRSKGALYNHILAGDFPARAQGGRIPEQEEARIQRVLRKHKLA